MARREDEPKYTTAEKAKLTWLVARMAKRGLADDRVAGGRVHQGDLQAKVDRIVEGARKRQQKRT